MLRTRVRKTEENAKPNDAVLCDSADHHERWTGTRLETASAALYRGRRNEDFYVLTHKNLKEKAVHPRATRKT
jgi:hypothetical protein